MDQYDFQAICPAERARSSLVRATAVGALRVAFRRGEVVGAFASGCLKGIALWHLPGTPKLPTTWEQFSYPIPWRCFLNLRTLWSLSLIGRAIRNACPRREGWHLAGLAVLHDARGTGIGSRLVKAGQDRAREGGHPVSAISVRGVLPFYEALGFTREGSSAAVKNLVEFHAVQWLPEGTRC